MLAHPYSQEEGPKGPADSDFYSPDCTVAKRVQTVRAIFQQPDQETLDIQIKSSSASTKRMGHWRQDSREREEERERERWRDKSPVRLSETRPGESPATGSVDGRGRERRVERTSRVVDIVKSLSCALGRRRCREI